MRRANANADETSGEAATAADQAAKARRPQSRPRKRTSPKIEIPRAPRQGFETENDVEPGRAVAPPSGTELAASLVELVDDERCDLVLTTGGTGPAPRDVTPEATLAVADREMPGFGEQMRQISLHFVPTAILSRQVAVIRGKTLIINLPGQPKSIRETLEGLKDAEGKQLVHGIFAAVPYCIDLIGGPYIETDDAVCKAFRPKSALRPKA